MCLRYLYVEGSSITESMGELMFAHRELTSDVLNSNTQQTGGQQKSVNKEVHRFSPEQ